MEKLADAAVMMAARGARQYLDTHKLTADPAALTACLKSWVKAKFPEALADAKAAIDAGMHQMAEATFAATMKLAGIEAAKEASKPSATANRRARRNDSSYSGPPYAPWFPLLSSPVRKTIIRDKRLLAKRGIKSRVHFHKGDWYLSVRDKDRERAQGITLEYVPEATPRQLRRRFYRKSRHPERRMRFQIKEARKQERGILRNARSYTRPMSDEESWTAMQWMYKHDPTRYQIARRVTMAYLQERLGGSGHGISSSDVNHTMAALIRMGDVIVTPGAPWRKRALRNASIESKWPRMTERQRVEALRIVGIERDVADTWGYKTWEQLSSVVRQLLVRSWRHGGDTTKIRRVPVGAR